MESTKRCPACKGPTTIGASTRIEYRREGRETHADEIEIDAVRCLNPGCVFANVDLAAVR